MEDAKYKYWKIGDKAKHRIFDIEGEVIALAYNCDGDLEQVKIESQGFLRKKRQWFNILLVYLVKE